MIPEAAVDNGRMTITEFLEARIAEDEGVARFALNKGSGLDVEDFESGDAYARNVLVIGRDRVLAECAAKRAIIESHPTQIYSGIKGQEVMECLTCERFPCDTLKAVASVYASHPDYRQEWAL